MAKSKLTPRVHSLGGVAYSIMKEGDHPGVEAVIDMDDPKVATAMDSRAQGEEVIRLVVVKGGKRQIIWISVSCFYSQPKLRVQIGGKSSASDKSKVFTLRPWLKVAKDAKGDYVEDRSEA